MVFARFSHHMSKSSDLAQGTSTNRCPFQRNIRNIRQLVSMREDERRALLRSLANDEYANVMSMCASLPHVEMNVKTEGAYWLLLNRNSSTIHGQLVTCFPSNLASM